MTAPQLAEHFEVSVRTIYRDIDALSAAGVPVYSTPGKGGGVSLLEGYTLQMCIRDRALSALQRRPAAGPLLRVGPYCARPPLLAVSYTHLHEINYAAFYSDYICAFKDGRIAKFGTVEEVMTKETLSQIYQVDFEIMEIEGRPLSIYY